VPGLWILHLTAARKHRKPAPRRAAAAHRIQVRNTPWLSRATYDPER
jgi:hypothetical protein